MCDPSFRDRLHLTKSSCISIHRLVATAARSGWYTVAVFSRHSTFIVKAMTSGVAKFVPE
jgi:hypothetical protein